MDLIKDKNPTLVSELLPDLVNVGIIQRTLQNLLRERIPVKNLTIVLETIADMASLTKNPDDLSEQARRRLGMYFVKEFEVEPDKLLALTFEPKLEQTLIGRVKRSQFDIGLVMDPHWTEGIIKEIEPKIKEMTEKGLTPLIVTTSEPRPLPSEDSWNLLTLSLSCLLIRNYQLKLELSLMRRLPYPNRLFLMRFCKL